MADESALRNAPSYVALRARARFLVAWCDAARDRSQELARRQTEHRAARPDRPVGCDERATAPDAILDAMIAHVEASLAAPRAATRALRAPPEEGAAARRSQALDRALQHLGAAQALGGEWLG